MKTWKEILRMPCELGDGEGGGCDEDCPCCGGDGYELPCWVEVVSHNTESKKAEVLAPYLADLWRLQGQAERLALLMPGKAARIEQGFREAVRMVDSEACREHERLEASA